MLFSLAVFSFLSLLYTTTNAHISIYHPSMWGFNVTDKTYSYDNRPVTPLTDYTFDQWWFHNHLDHPPNPGDIFELPAGKPATTELACNKGATTWFNSSEGGDIRDKNNPNDPCPGQDMSEWHTTGINDLFGCSLAIAYKSDVTQVQPEDFTVFSVNHTCVWTRFTDFQVPAAMPPCPEGGCICAWFWIHSPDSGGEQNYMNGFRCNVTGSTSNVPLATPQLARRCGADPENGKPQASPGNCTYGAKQPFYWFQKERNNMFEGTYAPPRYLDMYNFLDGAQNDIFQNSYPSGLPPPSPNSTIVPTPAPFNAAAPAATPAPASSASSSASAATSFSSISSSSSAAVASSSSSASSSGVSSSSSSSLVSVSVSTATVFSTAVVTQFPSSSVPPPSSAPPVSTSTVVKVVYVTVSAADDAASPISSSSPLPTSTVYNTVVAFVTETASAAPAASPSADIRASNSTIAAFAEFDILESANSTSSNSSSIVNGAAKMCKRDATADLSARHVQARSKYFSSVPGLHSYRKLKKRSSIWKFF